MAGLMDSILNDLQKADGSVVMTIKEYADNQYGMPLPHYALQYLYAATGLRFGVFHSISGVPQSCKSPLLMELMRMMCAPRADGGSEGISYLYDLEDKVSPTLLTSMFSKYPDMLSNSRSPFKLVKHLTLEDAQTHLVKKVLPAFKKAGSYSIPFMAGFDSIGGAAAEDVVAKIETDGTASKGFYDKAHIMKYLCESWGQLVGRLPVIFIVINQEKDEVGGGTPGHSGPPRKKITGGISQVFKAGHIVSTAYRRMPLGDGKIITMSTNKTSFSDARKIEVSFRWNQFGSLESESQGHRWEWAEASARVLANPAVVGDLRDIANVSVATSGLVTCPQIGVKSVPAVEFEAALFDPANSKVLSDLYSYQKIDRLKSPLEYAEYIKVLTEKDKKGKEEDKEEVKTGRAAKIAAEKAKEDAKRARKEAQAAKSRARTAPAPSFKALAAMAKSGNAARTAEETQEVPDVGEPVV